MSTFSPQFLHSMTFLHVHELEMAVNADKTIVMIVAFLMSMKIHLCLCTLLCVTLYNARRTEQIFPGMFSKILELKLLLETTLYILLACCHNLHTLVSLSPT